MPDFESIYTRLEAAMVKDAYDAVTECNLWEWMRTYSPNDGMGFMFSSHPNLTEINKHMKMLDDHSGASYGWTMRQLESIAKKGWESHANEVRWVRAMDALKEWADETRASRGKPCGCRAAKGYTSGWCGVAGGGVPGCDH